MGIVTMGPDFRLIKFIKDNYQVKNFIETGTFYGGTTEWASDHFEQVYSVEFSEYWYNKTKERLTKHQNVKIIFGDTRSMLPGILSKVNNGILWLDAHWCSDHSYGEDDQCPILDELEIINSFIQLNEKLFILIDDARLFLSPPHHPHSLKDYPDIVAIIDVLKIGKRKIFVFNDIIIGVPEIYGETFGVFLQDIATIDLQKENDKAEIPRLGLLRRVKNKLKKMLNATPS